MSMTNGYIIRRHLRLRRTRLFFITQKQRHLWTVFVSLLGETVLNRSSAMRGNYFWKYFSFNSFKCVTIFEYSDFTIWNSWRSLNESRIGSMWHLAVTIGDYSEMCWEGPARAVFYLYISSTKKVKIMRKRILLQLETRLELSEIKFDARGEWKALIKS